MTWTSTTTNVDIETGEVLQKRQLKNYIKIKTIKKIEYDKYNSKGHVKYTNEYRKSNQIELFNNE